LQAERPEPRHVKAPCSCNICKMEGLHHQTRMRRHTTATPQQFSRSFFHAHAACEDTHTHTHTHTHTAPSISN
jgi:hypothetical protein